MSTPYLLSIAAGRAIDLIDSMGRCRPADYPEWRQACHAAERLQIPEGLGGNGTEAVRGLQEACLRFHGSAGYATRQLPARFRTIINWVALREELSQALLTYRRLT